MTKLSELGLLLLKDLISDLCHRGDQIEAACLAQLLSPIEDGMVSCPEVPHDRTA